VHRATLPCFPSLRCELWHSTYWFFSEASREIWSRVSKVHQSSFGLQDKILDTDIRKIPFSSLEFILPRVICKSRHPSQCCHQLAYKGCQLHNSLPGSLPTSTPKHRQEDTFRFPLANSKVSLVINSLIDELFGFDLQTLRNTQKSNPHHPQEQMVICKGEMYI